MENLQHEPEENYTDEKKISNFKEKLKKLAPPVLVDGFLYSLFGLAVGILLIIFWY